MHTSDTHITHAGGTSGWRFGCYTGFCYGGHRVPSWYTHMYTSTLLHICTNIQKHIHTHSHAHSHTHTHTHARAHMQTHTQAHTHTHIHIRTLTHTHAHMCVCLYIYAFI